MLRDEGYEVTALFLNPNIHPVQEYLRRRQAMHEVSRRLDLPVIWRDAEYNPALWLRDMVWREQPGARCRVCYATRLERTRAVARHGGYGAFTTSLLYSRRQRHDMIAELGHGMTDDGPVPFLYRDFRTGWQQGIDTAREWGIHRQNYCGCLYSEAERFARDFARATGKEERQREA